jgi:hypothetical protein
VKIQRVADNPSIFNIVALLFGFKNRNGVICEKMPQLFDYGI